MKKIIPNCKICEWLSIPKNILNQEMDNLVKCSAQGYRYITSKIYNGKMCKVLFKEKKVEIK